MMFLHTLKRDLGTDNKTELEFCKANQEGCRAGRAAQSAEAAMIDSLIQN